MRPRHFHIHIVIVVSILFSMVSTVSPAMAAQDVTTDMHATPAAAEAESTEPATDEIPVETGEPATGEAPELPAEPETPAEPEEPVVPDTPIENELPVIETPAPVSLTPLDPIVVDAACVDGATGIPSISHHAQDGATYTVEGELAPGASVVVRATLAEGYAFNDLTGTNWTIDAAIPNSAVLTVTLANPDCEPVDIEQPTDAAVDATGDEDTPSLDGTPDAAASTMTGPRELPLAVGCGTAPYPAPTGSQITNAIDSIVADPTELDSNWSSFTLNISWSLKASASGGDYFTLTLPEAIDTDPMYFPMNDRSGNTVACASIAGGVATVVLTDFVEGRSNISGNASFAAWLEVVEYTEETQVEINFGEFGTIIVTVPGDYEEPGPDEPSPHAWKSGWWSQSDQGFENGENALTWMIHLPASENGFTNVVVTDVAQDGWWFSCDDIWGTGGPVDVEPSNLDYSVDCDTTAGLTVSIPGIPADTNVELYFYGSIETAAPGPFSNSFSATGFETESITRSYTIARSTGGGDGQGDLIVTPITPEVTGNVCTDGEYTPQVHAEDGNGITYDVTSEIDEAGNYTVVATKSDYQAWDDLSGTGWVVSTENPEQAIYNGSVELTPCVEALPVIPTITGNACIGGEYTPPVISVNAPESGISYTIGAIDTETGAYTVTATIPGTMVWGEMDEGWTIDSATRATFAGSVELAPCVDVLPAIPAVTQAVCTGGALVPPTITPVETDGITYELSGGIAPGATVIVTATLGDGYAWPATMPEGWTSVNDTTATHELTLEDVACEEVIPATPIVSQGVCTGGAFVEPTVALQDTSGVTYEMEGDVVSGNTVTVTATLDDDREWGTMPEGWTQVNATTATYLVTLEDTSCIPVVPVNPEITEAVCVDGDSTDPSVTLPESGNGISYTVGGDVVPGGTIVVTATLEDGVMWGEMPEGWTLVDHTTATFTVILDSVACETPADPESPARDVTMSALPNTGSGAGTHESLIASWMLLATAMVLAGAGVMTRAGARR